MPSSRECEMTGFDDEPYRYLIDQAIEYVLEKDPSWDHFQPIGFRATVVEHWKRNIHTEVWAEQIRWSLPIGDREFFILRPLFGLYDNRYNPYLKKSSQLPAGFC